MNRSTGPGVWMTAVIIAAGLQSASGEPPNKPIIPEDASEVYLVQRIKRIDGQLREAMPKIASPRQEMAARHALLIFVDELLDRYPETTSKEYALITKLKALADLARRNPVYLARLLVVTEEIGRSMPTGELAEENTFYAIQAFVIAARQENMPQERRLHGTIERYEAFVEEHPDSPRAAVIRASMIRDLIALSQLDKALEELSTLQRTHPKHPATRRAEGEVNRVRAVGRPFSRILTMSDGQMVRPSDYVQRVLVIHFWTSRSKRSREQAPKLATLHNEYHGRGLELVSINVDVDRERARQTVDSMKIQWPQYYEPKGIDSDVIIDNGVVAWPTFFIIDRKGILHAVDNGGRLPELLAGLFPEPSQQKGLAPSKSP